MTQPATPDAPEVETTTTTHEETTTTETSPVQPEPETDDAHPDPLGAPTPDHEQPAAPYVNAPNGDSDDAQPE